jgi:hypothetical protein
MPHLRIKVMTKGWVSMRHCDYNCISKTINKTNCHKYTKTFRGKAMAQVASCQPLTVEVYIWSQAIPSGTRDGSSDIRTGVHANTLVLPCHYHSTNDPQPTDLALMLDTCSKWQLPYIPRHIYTSPDGKAHKLTTSQQTRDAIQVYLTFHLSQQLNATLSVLKLWTEC